MQTTIDIETVETAKTSKTANATRWIGRILSAVPVAFLIFDGVIKVLNLQPVIDSSIQLGLPITLAPSLGILLLACIALYVFPRTAALGAILLTGYLGGAIAIQARVNAAPFSLIFPLLIGALVWGGLFLRNQQMRALVSLRSL